MGDPFWRRFSSARERERALASEFAQVDTRSLSRASVGSMGTSRNDLFTTDWKWKGRSGEEERQGDSGRGYLERNAFLSSSGQPHQTTQDSTARQEVSYLDRIAGGLEIQPSRTASSSSLGAPIQLASCARVSADRHSLPSSVQTRRSRNATIYDVNHLTITPPKASSHVDHSPEIPLLPDERHNRHTTWMRKRPPHQSPLSRGHTSAPVSDSSSSSRSADSAITSFTADQPETTATMTSPVTPITPAVPRFQTTVSPKLDSESAILSPAERIPSSETGVKSPQDVVSLSRSSSMTIAHSPFTALANVTRKAGLLLLDDVPESVESGHREYPEENSVRLRVDITSRKWLVGYGRYAKVFLGSYRIASTGWQLCAVKLFDADPESAEMARREASMLRYLQEDESMSPAWVSLDGREFILECLALVDERAIELPPTASLDESSRRSSLAGTPTRNNSRRASSTVLLRIATEGSSPAAGNVVANRADSALDRASETSAMLQRSRCHAALKVPAEITIHRPILLVPFYANGSMATFLKTREGGIDSGLWSTWFQQGLAALAWCKRKGVLHNDIKVSPIDNRKILGLISVRSPLISWYVNLP